MPNSHTRMDGIIRVVGWHNLFACTPHCSTTVFLYGVCSCADTEGGAGETTTIQSFFWRHCYGDSIQERGVESRPQAMLGNGRMGEWKVSSGFSSCSSWLCGTRHAGPKRVSADPDVREPARALPAATWIFFLFREPAMGSTLGPGLR